VKTAIRNLIDGIPFCPVPVRLKCSSTGVVDFWWSRVAADIDISSSGMVYRGTENGDLEFMKRYLREGMCFVDIGAYHGLYTVVAGRRVGQSGRVVMFEPSPAACRRARLNLLLNRISAEIENAAVTDSTGTVVYHQVINGIKTMGGLRRPATGGPVRTRRVRSVSLDDFCRERSIRGIDLLKIDVEGAERDLFVGAAHVLEHLRPLIICEVLDWVTEPWGYRARELVATLSVWDYRWFDIDGQGALSEHVAREAYPDIRNYLAVPEERCESLAAELAQP
jgi:FkbM family methyltransferase